MNYIIGVIEILSLSTTFDHPTKIRTAEQHRPVLNLTHLSLNIHVYQGYEESNYFSKLITSNWIFYTLSTKIVQNPNSKDC